MSGPYRDDDPARRPASRVVRGAAMAIVLAACGRNAAAEAPREPDLFVPPMPEAGAPGASAPSRKIEPAARGGPSYEEALATLSAAPAPPGIDGARDLTDAELRAPMRDAHFVAACGAPDDMKVTVRVVLRDGRARGVTVTTSPPDDGVVRCVDARVRGMRWAASPKVDSFTTTY